MAVVDIVGHMVVVGSLVVVVVVHMVGESFVVGLVADNPVDCTWVDFASFVAVVDIVVGHMVVVVGIVDIAVVVVGTCSLVVVGIVVVVRIVEAVADHMVVVGIVVVGRIVEAVVDTYFFVWELNTITERYFPKSKWLEIAPYI